MKYKLFSAFGLLVAMVFLFSSCTKDDVVKANDDYDFSKIVPITAVSGPAAVIASGQTAGIYLAPSRGGSTYAWAVVASSAGISGTITTDEDSPWEASILFDQTGVKDSVNIQVIETTMAGVVSAMVSMETYMLPFCPMDLNAYTGDYIEADGDGQTAPIVVALDPNNTLFGIVINGLLGQDYWWGPPGGILKVNLNACDNSLFFDKQKTGIVSSTYGDVSMEMVDPQPGWFDPADFSFGYQGKVTVAAGSFGDYAMVYTVAP